MYACSFPDAQAVFVRIEDGGRGVFDASHKNNYGGRECRNWYCRVSLSPSYSRCKTTMDEGPFHGDYERVSRFLSSP